MSTTTLNYKENDTIPRVDSIASPRTGNPVANQFTIRVGDKEYLQSYRSIIAVKDYSTYPAKVVLDEYYWNYSTTTGKYRNEFLGENIAETRKKIELGEYATANLN